MTPGELDEELDEELAAIADRHRHPQPIDPLHARARAAIERTMVSIEDSESESIVAALEAKR